jgi:hypothetical protein
LKNTPQEPSPWPVFSLRLITPSFILTLQGRIDPAIFIESAPGCLPVTAIGV